MLPFAERLDIAAELTHALTLATRSGQEHLMRKVLAILRPQILEIRDTLSGRQAVGLLDSMSELEHEAGRIAPGPIAFNRCAQAVIDALVRATDTSAFSTV